MSGGVTDSQEMRIREDERRKLWEHSLEDKFDHIQDDVADIKKALTGNEDQPGLIGDQRSLSTRITTLEKRISSTIKWLAGIAGTLITAGILYLFKGP